MLQQNGLNAYRETKVKTAGQDKLIIMLYDGAIKNVKIATELLRASDVKCDKVNDAIKKAQDFITELMVSLDFEKGGDIASNLFSLYRFFNEQLLEANLKKEEGSLPEIATMLEELKSAWIQIFKSTPIPQTHDYHGVNISR
ncbi:MAG: flagellar export chaperone FliS [Spirochaetales bacterium]|nr:flagellar export chaperone FliS [Spirochaetales bacterium]